MGRAVRGGYAIYAPASYLRNKQEIQNRPHHQKDACIHHGKKSFFYMYRITELVVFIFFICL